MPVGAGPAAAAFKATPISAEASTATAQSFVTTFLELGFILFSFSPFTHIGFYEAIRVFIPH
jgi:hypothetical protein